MARRHRCGSIPTGFTEGGFPSTTGAYQAGYGGSVDVFVTKLNAAGNARVYSTYLGGSGADFGRSIAVDASGNAYVTGSTNGSFPTTTGNYQTTFGGGDNDVFVTKLNAAGTARVYSTYLGGPGSDAGYGIAIDGSSGNAYVTGDTSGSFPTIAGGFQTTYAGGLSDVFVTKLNAAGSALTSSTYLGGIGTDEGFGIAVDGSGSAYVTGQTGGSFPTTAGSDQTTYGGSTYDAFIAKVSDPDLANGMACAQAGLCASQLCVDGVCCDKACTGQCEACDVTGHVGTCTPVTGAPHAPHAACQLPTTTACTATCDGTNIAACAYACQPSGTCLDDHRLQSADNGIKDCTPYKCTAGACAIGCASVDDCLSPNVCDPNGKCVSPSSSSGDSGCNASSNGAPPWGTVLVTAFAAFFLARSRRRARSMS